MADEEYPGAAPPPPGVTPDLDNPHDSGRRQLLGWLIACNALALIFFAVRAYAQVWMRHRILLEDGTPPPNPTGWPDLRNQNARIGMLTGLFQVTCALSWVC